jgi:hypothetical protein
MGRSAHLPAARVLLQCHSGDQSSLRITWQSWVHLEHRAGRCSIFRSGGA